MVNTNQPPPAIAVPTVPVPPVIVIPTADDVMATAHLVMAATLLHLHTLRMSKLTPEDSPGMLEQMWLEWRALRDEVRSDFDTVNTDS